MFDTDNGFAWIFIVVVIVGIAYYTFLLALGAMVLCAIGASLVGIGVGVKNFYLTFNEAHEEAKLMPSRPARFKFIFPGYDVQPARLTYFYDAGWYVIKYITLNVRGSTQSDAHKWLAWGQSFLVEGKFLLSGNFFQKIWSAIRFYGPGFGLIIGWGFHFVAALGIVGVFIGLQFIFLCVGLLLTGLVTFLLGVGTYIYGSFYKVYYRCPTCHEQIKIPTYICPTCNEPHTRLWPSVYGVAHHTCLGTHKGSLCGESLPTLTFIGRDKLTTRCPCCNYEIVGLGGTNAHIPIVGAPNSGKSIFTTMAVWQLLEKYRPLHGLEITLPDSNHLKKYENSIKTLKDGRLLLKTAKADDGAKAVNIELRTPNQAVPNLLYLYDTAGEDTATDDAADQQKYFKYVNGVFLILDPFSIPMVWKKYESQLPRELKIFSPSEKTLDNLFSQIIQLFKTKVQTVGNKKISQPIAVILTKTDACDLEEKVGTSAAKRYIQANPGKANDENDAINILVEDFLNSNGCGNLVRNLHQNFSNVKFFSCSALGTEVGSGAFEGIRVLDPMLWLFEQADVLPNKAPIFKRIVLSRPFIKYGLPIIAMSFLSAVGYGGYTVLQWSLDFLNSKSQSSQLKQNINELPVNSPLTQDRPLKVENSSQASVNRPSSAPQITSPSLSKDANDISSVAVVERYYSSIREENYEAAWNILPESMQNNRQLHPRGFESFKEWYSSVENIEIRKISLKSETSQSAIINFIGNYTIRASKRNLKINLLYYLIKDANLEWKIEKIIYKKT